MRELMMFLLLLAVSPCAFGEPTQEVGATKNAIQFDLTLEKTTFEVGEPIEARIRLTNLGQRTISVPVTGEISGRHEGYWFAVQRDDGEKLIDPMNEYISFMHSLGSLKAIPPKESYNRTLPLNYRVPVLKPGCYSVRATYRPHRVPNVDVESQSVQFQIVETPPDSLNRRIESLVEELQAGGEAGQIARRLGFTGGKAAIDPLIEILYHRADGIQVAASEALLYIDHESVKKSLIAALEKQGPRKRMIHLLITQLKASPDEVVPLLRQWLDDDNADVRYSALEGLFLSQNYPKDRKLFHELRPRLRDSDYRVRAHAAAVIGSSYSSTEALQALILALNDVAPSVREQTTTAIGWIATKAETPAVRKEAINTLLKLLKSGTSLAQTAAYWLGRIDDRIIRDEMKNVYRTTDDLELKRELKRVIAPAFAQ